MASGIIQWAQLGYTESAIIFLGIPAVYLTFRVPRAFKKTLFFSLAVTPPLVLMIDYMAHVARAWYEVTGASKIRVLSAFPADAFVWGFFYSFFIIIFYEYFFERDHGESGVSKRITVLLATLLLMISVFSLVILVSPALLIVEHFYTILVLTLFVIPTVLVLRRYPKLISKIALQGLFFVAISIIYEVTALNLGQWSFPGHNYLAWISLGHIRIPFEELMWIMLAVPAYVCIYEFFADDCR